MFDMFQLPFMVQAFAAAVITGILLSYLGVHVVGRGIVFVPSRASSWPNSLGSTVPHQCGLVVPNSSVTPRRGSDATGPRGLGRPVR